MASVLVGGGLATLCALLAGIAIAIPSPGPTELAALSLAAGLVWPFFVRSWVARVAIVVVLALGAASGLILGHANCGQGNGAAAQMCLLHPCEAGPYQLDIMGKYPQGKPTGHCEPIQLGPVGRGLVAARCMTLVPLREQACSWGG